MQLAQCQCHVHERGNKCVQKTKRVEWQLESILFYEQEEITNYEVGIKGNVLDNRVQLAAAAYVMDWEHYNQAYTVTFRPDDLAAEQGKTSLVMFLV